MPKTKVYCTVVDIFKDNKKEMCLEFLFNKAAALVSCCLFFCGSTVVIVPLNIHNLFLRTNKIIKASCECMLS